MNRNWLYRVLAMALIVMMAMPFAMAEEVEAQTNNVEEVVESNVFDLEGAAVESNNVEVETGEDIIFSEDADVEVDKSLDKISVTQVEDFSSFYDVKSIKLTSSKTAVAKVSGSNPTWIVTLKKKGTTTLKLGYKYKLTEKSSWHNGSKKMKLEVKDEYAINKVKANYSDDTFVPSYPDKSETKTSYSVDIGLGDVILPFAENSDHESVDYGVDSDNWPAVTGWGLYDYKWSSVKVGTYVGEDGEASESKGIIDLSELEEDEDEDEEGSAVVPYHVVFKKKGTTKVTFTSRADDKKKVTVTFKVGIPKKFEYKAKNSDKPKAGKDDKIELVVKSAKYTDATTLEAVVWVANGTGSELKGAIDGISLETRNAIIGTEGTLTFQGKIGKQKTGEAKIKFKAEPEKSSEGQLVFDSDVEYEEEDEIQTPKYGKLFELKKGVYVNQEVAETAFGDLEVECNKVVD